MFFNSINSNFTQTIKKTQYKMLTFVRIDIMYMNGKMNPSTVDI